MSERIRRVRRLRWRLLAELLEEMNIADHTGDGWRCRLGKLANGRRHGPFRTLRGLMIHLQRRHPQVHYRVVRELLRRLERRLGPIPASALTEVERRLAEEAGLIVEVGERRYAVA